MQFPEELQLCFVFRELLVRSLNEVQFPEELQRGSRGNVTGDAFPASMKCSSRRNCNLASMTSLI